MLKKLILIGSLTILYATPLSSYARTVEERLFIQSIIVAEAARYDVDPGLGVFLSAVESDFNPNARSGESTASGLFQWIRGSFLGICIKKYGIAKEPSDVFNPVLNARCAMKTISEGGISHWTASGHTSRKLFRAGFITIHNQLVYND